MSSIAAKEVAKDVLEAIGKGERPHLQNILVKNGYAESTARGMAKQVTNTKSYQEVINPVVLAMEKERQAVLDRLPKVRNSAKYHHLTDGLDKLTKNIQLLNGGKTSEVGLEFSWQKE